MKKRVNGKFIFCALFLLVMAMVSACSYTSSTGKNEADNGAVQIENNTENTESDATVENESERESMQEVEKGESQVNAQENGTSTESDENRPEGETQNGIESDISESQQETEADEPEVIVVEVPDFSAEGGFYDDAFTLILSAGDAEEIYYTLDGSDPRTSDTVKVYQDGIAIYDNTNEPNVWSAVEDIALYEHSAPDFNVDKGIVVRAVVKAASGEYSDVVAQSYFVGKTASYYKSMRVISMVTDGDYLFDPDTGIYMVGSEYYKWKDSISYTDHGTHSPENPTNYNKDGKEAEIPVTIQVMEEGKSVYTEDVGARISGCYSRGATQKSIRFFARKEYGSSKMKYTFFDELIGVDGNVIKKFDKLTLRNGGSDGELHFRDAIAQEMAAGLEVGYMASEPYILFINGEFWGFYLMREKPDGYYIQSHYGINEKDVAVIKNGDIEAGADTDRGEYRSFTSWAAQADMTQEENFQKFCDKIDLQSFMDYITVETYVNNSDWGHTYLNNWMVWKSKTVNPEIEKADGKWRFILYDLDASAAMYSDINGYYGDTINTMGNINWFDYNYVRIFRKLCKNETFRELFYENYLRVMEQCFLPERTEAIVDKYINEYRDAIIATQYRYGNTWDAEHYDEAAERLRRFYQKRPAYAKNQVEYCLGLTDTLLERKLDKDYKVVRADGKYEYDAKNNLVPSIATWGCYGDAEWNFDENNNTFSIRIPQAQEYVWDIQTETGKFTMEQGKRYYFGFEIIGDTAGEFEPVIFRNADNDWPSFWLEQIEISEGSQTIGFELFWNMETRSDWQVGFKLGLLEGKFEIRNPFIIELD